MSLLNGFLIIVSMAGILLLIFGLSKKAQLYIFFGGIAFLAPIFYLIGWIFLLPMAPPIALAISFLARKKEQST
jgi:hypothetical protein